MKNRPLPEKQAKNRKTGKPQKNNRKKQENRLCRNPAHFRDWVGEDLGFDHNTIVVFSHTPLIDKLPPQTVMLYHKADWKDNQIFTNTPHKHTTIQDIDNYVNTLTDTINKR